jgi:hypothetical protein
LPLRFAARFLRAPIFFGFAIGFGLAVRLRLPVGFRLARRFRAFLRLGARTFVARPRFRLASMTLALVPFAGLTRVTLRTFAVRTVASITFCPFTIVPFTRFTGIALRSFTIGAITGGRFVRVALAGRGFFCFTGASFACRRVVAIARRALPCRTLFALAFRAGPLGRFPAMTLAGLTRRALSRVCFAGRGFPPLTLAGFAFLLRLTFARRRLVRVLRLTRTRRILLGIPCRLRILHSLLVAPGGVRRRGCCRFVARNRAGIRRSRPADSKRACVRFRSLACRLRISRGLRLTCGPGVSRRLRILLGLLVAPGGFRFHGRQRFVTRDRAGVRRRRLTRSTRACLRFRRLACRLRSLRGLRVACSLSVARSLGFLRGLSFLRSLRISSGLRLSRARGFRRRGVQRSMTRDRNTTRRRRLRPETQNGPTARRGRGLFPRRRTAGRRWRTRRP